MIDQKLCTHKEHVGERLLPIESFNKKGANRRQSYCRECQKTYSKKHYGDNKEYYAEKRDSWRGANKAQ